MLRTLFRAMGYLYVALALAPLAAITIGFALYLALGENPWRLWSAWRNTIGSESQLEGQQLVSFRTSLLAVPNDALSGVAARAPDLYAVGVGHVALRRQGPPSIYDSADLAVIAGDSSFTEQMSAYDVSFSASARMGQFDNILIFDRRTGDIKKLFDKRVSIKRFQLVKASSRQALVVFAADLDTNKDGKLDVNDIHGVYAYTPDDGQLHKVSGVVGNPAALDQAQDSDIRLIRATLDRNNDGTAAAYSYGVGTSEPQVLYRLDLNTFAATPLVPQTLVDELQRTIDTPVTSKKQEQQ